jgi:hypothetical protein
MRSENLKGVILEYLWLRLLDSFAQFSLGLIFLNIWNIFGYIWCLLIGPHSTLNPYQETPHMPFAIPVGIWDWHPTPVNDTHCWTPRWCRHVTTVCPKNVFRVHSSSQAKWLPGQRLHIQKNTCNLSIKWPLYKMSSQVLGTRTWLLKPQSGALYKKLVAFLHDGKTASKWPLYKKLVLPTWFLHTTMCLQCLGNQPHFSV